MKRTDTEGKAIGEMTQVAWEGTGNVPSDDFLRSILLTCDGRGKEAKEKALEALILRAKAETINWAETMLGVRIT